MAAATMLATARRAPHDLVRAMKEQQQRAIELLALRAKPAAVPRAPRFHRNPIEGRLPQPALSQTVEERRSKVWSPEAGIDNSGRARDVQRSIAADANAPTSSPVAVARSLEGPTRDYPAIGFSGAFILVEAVDELSATIADVSGLAANYAFPIPRPVLRRRLVCAVAEAEVVLGRASVVTGVKAKS